MKIQDLLNTSRNAGDADITYISVWLPKDALAHLEITLESHWMPAKKGWMYRVDPENPAIPQQRHVHIAQKQHTSAKGMQVSWNIDGTRHDNKTFNQSIGQQNYVRDLAREVLKLDSTITLENNGNDTQGGGQYTNDTPTFSQDGSEAYIRFTMA
ncbi:DUF6367 family protein [Pseudomonas juntendi]|uniref:DUF6367 family protein n=1 Tax=Pseudomonas juntendi TaxID=2666183 RepID=A0ABD4YCV3_9PSED|nr:MULTISPECIES: DUF6367 family protein [Pseudomonas]MDH0757049.1 DUF6367 family protein [Pseudomonas juntendi]MDH1922549.1 DUF6367 family protein [Pseudomonas juntendi]RRV55507.1 hypothetical protein EGJ15_24400 [Pseudomonas sp. p99-361]